MPTPDDLNTLLQLGNANLRQGNYEEGMDHFRMILRLDPNHVAAHYNIGLALQLSGRFDDAVVSYQQVLKIDPNLVVARNNLGTALKALGRLDEAIACYEQVLRLQPASADALTNLANALAISGKTDAALTNYRQALRLRPGHAPTHYNLGLALFNAGHIPEAIEQFQLVARLDPNHAEALCRLGLALLEQDKVDAAETNFRQALRLDPKLAEAHNGLGTILRQRDEPERAVSCFREALRLKPDFPPALNNLGIALAKQGKEDEAEASFRQAIRIEPGNVDALNNLGKLLMDQGRLEDSAAYYREAIRNKPDAAESYSNLGSVLQSQNKLSEASECYEQALRLDPDHSRTHWNRSLLWLLQGDFERGWPEYEWRWTRPEFHRRGFQQSLWDGADLHGRTILLHVEQGLGDFLQFIRYVPLVKQRGGKVIVECHPSLVRLLTCVEEIDVLLGFGSPLPPFDVQAPLLSLPGIFRTDLDTIPATVPYLRANAQLVEHWRQELASSGSGRTIKIGIAWQGNPTYGADRLRSIPLRQFAPLAQAEGVQLVSLQKGPATSQIADLPGLFQLLDLSTRIDEATENAGSLQNLPRGAFMDTAAIMSCLDLVISSDTVIPHLAGALGVPVWVALPVVPDWRWLLEREDCPWYPTMRLFRQREQGQWPEVFQRMAAALQGMCARRAD
jgi:tetratricopeptide (TPR) repeat protein